MYQPRPLDCGSFGSSSLRKAAKGDFMRRDLRTIAWFVLVMLALAFGSASAADQALLTQARGLFKPLPKVIQSRENPVTPEKVALGRLLFFEPRVSLDGTVSC